jgi:hypothetical protein
VAEGAEIRDHCLTNRWNRTDLHAKALANLANEFASFMELKIQYHVHKRPQLYCALGQMNPTHTFKNHHFKVKSIVEYHLHASFSSGFIFSVFLTKLYQTFLTSPMHATCSTHIDVFYLVIPFIFGENTNYDTKKSVFNHSPSTFPPLRPNNLLSLEHFHDVRSSQVFVCTE